MPPSTLDPFMGRPDLCTRLDEIACKANWQAARHRYVLEQYGDRGVRQVTERLESESLRRAFLDPPPTMAWSTVATVVAIDRAIFEGPMERSFARMRHFGGEIAKYDVPGIYRAFFRLGTPGFVLGKLPVVWRQYFRAGSLRTVIGRGEADVALEGVVLPAYLCEHGIAGWFDAMLELVGARAPNVRHGRCVHRGDAECAWLATWHG